MLKKNEVNEIKILNGMESIITLMVDNYPIDRRVRKLWKKSLSLTRKAMKRQYIIASRYIDYGRKETGLVQR